MSWAYQYRKLSCLNNVSEGGDSLIVPASTSVYTGHWGLTHLDAIWGFVLYLKGTRYGTGDVTVQVQNALHSDAVWEDVTVPFLLSTGGTIGSPVAFDYQVPRQTPIAAGTFYPLVRLKITADAATSATIDKIGTTIRGAN